MPTIVQAEGVALAGKLILCEQGVGAPAYSNARGWSAGGGWPIFGRAADGMRPTAPSAPALTPTAVHHDRSMIFRHMARLGLVRNAP